MSRRLKMVERKLEDLYGYLQTEKERETDVYFVHFEYGDGRPHLCPLYALLLPQDRKMLKLVTHKPTGVDVQALFKFRGKWRPVMQVWKQEKAQGTDPALARSIPLASFFDVIKEAKDEAH